MPVCPHDWRKHSCSFCPAESCCIMGVLKALGSEQACLTKPWWLAAERRMCLRAGCQKLIFRFSVGCSGSSMTVWGLDILVRGEGWGWDMHVFCEGPESWLKKKKFTNWLFRINFKTKLVWGFFLSLLLFCLSHRSLCISTTPSVNFPN